MNKNVLRYVSLGAILVLLTAIAVLVSLIGEQMNARSDGKSAGQNYSGTLLESYQAFDSGDIDGALSAADDLVNKNRDDITALLAQASALVQKGSIEFREEEFGKKAIVVAKHILEIDPKNSEAWRIIGYAYEIMQDYPSAHDAYTKSIELDPQNSLAVSGDAHSYDLEGLMDKAESGYRHALELDGNNTAAKMGLARVALYRGNMEEALRLYRSVADAPGNARMRAGAAYSAGQIEELQGAYANAETDFRLATTYDERYAPAWVGLATELYRQAVLDRKTLLSNNERSAKAAESFEYLQKAIELNSFLSSAHYQLATEMIGLGRYDDAVLILSGLDKQIIEQDISLSFIAKAAMHDKVTTALGAAQTLRDAQ